MSVIDGPGPVAGDATRRRIAARDRGMRQVRAITGAVGVATAGLATVFAVSMAAAPEASSAPAAVASAGEVSQADGAPVEPRPARPSTAHRSARAAGDRLAAPTTTPRTPARWSSASAPVPSHARTAGS